MLKTLVKLIAGSAILSVAACASEEEMAMQGASYGTQPQAMQPAPMPYEPMVEYEVTPSQPAYGAPQTYEQVLQQLPATVPFQMKPSPFKDKPAVQPVPVAQPVVPTVEYTAQPMPAYQTQSAVNYQQQPMPVAQPAPDMMPAQPVPAPQIAVPVQPAMAPQPYYAPVQPAPMQQPNYYYPPQQPVAAPGYEAIPPLLPLPPQP